MRGKPHAPNQPQRAGQGPSRRLLALAALTLPFLPIPSHAAALRRALPPALDPHAIGAALRAAHPARTRADWLALAAPANLPAQIAADFAAGSTVTVDGWLLARTEAMLCAAIG